MTARSILQVFDQYQKARLLFVQSVADFASRPNNIECLEAAGALDLLHPLLTDFVPSIQHMAAIALGKIASNDHRLAQAIIRKDILPHLLQNIDKQNKFYKKAALFVIRAIAKHSSELASIVIQNNGLDFVIHSLEDFDAIVKEAAAWALGYIARHNKTLAQTSVDAGAVPLLVLCLQEPELYVKQIAASALCDISKHDKDLAEVVVDAGAVPFLAKAVSNPDTKLKRQALSALTSIAKHSVNLAESVIETEIFPDVLVHMAHPDECVVKAAATLTREICKHTLEMAQLIVNIGGIGALVELIDTSKQTVRLPAIMAIGYIAGHSDQLAIAVIGSKGVIHLSAVLHEEQNDRMLAVTVWAIGQIGKHTPEHAKAVAVANILPKLLELYNDANSSEDLKSKCNTTLKQILQRCMYIEALEPLLHDSPPNILKYVLGQFSKVLPNDARARRLFVTSGGLKKVQEIQADPGSTLLEYIQIINCCFPEEIVRYYSPGYPDSLLEAVEQYQPKCPSLFAMEEHTFSDTDSKDSLSSHHEHG
ncbi:sperm-associated antigen 6-like isoform X1 [Hylaeus volcanicus]|uniref:sperm-associated antigen 6-like isoform X1 n=1 Tax=Hylaeus volcanicus TaxID=313075 RepID=UPI0023B77CB8|nr:sperm-associated antigen 6-like isoform X1 [Hylaeus volcanicus]XP_053988924.1 sperm-associated antigen 6-like isoform X1 [Hylaeus volcanicus]